MTDSVLSSIETAIDACRRGEMVIIVDDEDRENEGDLVMAAAHMTAEAVNFMVTEGRGLLCLAMRGAMLDRLKIPMMVPQAHNTSGFGTGFTISVEAAHGVTTGISAEDRAQTIQTLINVDSTPADIAMPGHIFPLRARDGGVLERRGQTEASVDLAELAGLAPAGAICEIMRKDGSMMRLPEMLEFASQHGLCVISVEQLAQYRSGLLNASTSTALPTDAETGHSTSAEVTLIGESRLPTKYGEFRISVFRDSQGFEHSALVCGKPDQTTPLVRLHSECLTGDTFASLRCDCGPQLHSAMQEVAEHGNGVVIYLRQEGRGIGLGNKIRAYALQEQGLDTVDANHELGFPTDAREYGVAADILKVLGINSLQLLSNNPDKVTALQSFGIDVVKRIPLPAPENSHNAAYLQTKAERMGHDINTKLQDKHPEDKKIAI
jgi:3,4-dihydroxy 2-butanone 4-phosphate synthase/GTP cyclohydrolase II